MSADLSKDDAIENFLTARQLAAKLQVSDDWIYEQASNGAMPSYRLGTLRRFRISEIEDWLQRHREPGTVAQVFALGR